MTGTLCWTSGVGTGSGSFGDLHPSSIQRGQQRGQATSLAILRAATPITLVPARPRVGSRPSFTRAPRRLFPGYAVNAVPSRPVHQFSSSVTFVPLDFSPREWIGVHGNHPGKVPTSV